MPNFSSESIPGWVVFFFILCFVAVFYKKEKYEKQQTKSSETKTKKKEAALKKKEEKRKKQLEKMQKEGMHPNQVAPPKQNRLKKTIEFLKK